MSVNNDSIIQAAPKTGTTQKCSICQEFRPPYTRKLGNGSKGQVLVCHICLRDQRMTTCHYCDKTVVAYDDKPCDDTVVDCQQEGKLQWFCSECWKDNNDGTEKNSCLCGKKKIQCKPGISKDYSGLLNNLIYLCEFCKSYPVFKLCKGCKKVVTVQGLQGEITINRGMVYFGNLPVCRSCWSGAKECKLCSTPAFTREGKAIGSAIAYQTEEPDSDYRCLFCNEHVVKDLGTETQYYLAAYHLMMQQDSEYGPRLPLIKLPKNGLDTVNAFKLKQLNTDKKGGSDLCGIYIPDEDGSGSKIYMLQSLPRVWFMAIAAHELTHAWQDQQGGELYEKQSDRLSEGFAEWVAYKVLEMIRNDENCLPQKMWDVEDQKEAKRLQELMRKNAHKDYGGGLNHFLEVGKKTKNMEEILAEARKQD